MPDSQSPAPRTTPLAAVHAGLGATMTDFAGWLMPLRYGSETAEHNAVRNAAGLFDLSHMGELHRRGRRGRGRARLRAAGRRFGHQTRPRAVHDDLRARRRGHRRPHRLPAGRDHLPGSRQRRQRRVRGGRAHGPGRRPGRDDAGPHGQLRADRDPGAQVGRHPGGPDQHRPGCRALLRRLSGDRRRRAGAARQDRLHRRGRVRDLRRTR